MQNDTFKPVTDAACLTVMDELSKHEPIFHRPELGTSRSDFEAMITDDFWEIGASGNIYNRDYILEVLEQRHSPDSEYQEDWETGDFYCRMIAENHYLLSYTLTLHGRLTRRTTLWNRTGDGWKAVFHQGTLVKQGEPT